MSFLTNSENIENIFKKHFQKSILLSLGGEVFKKGKFLLLKNYIIGNNFFFELYIEKSKKIDIVKIPYPFDLEEYEEDELIYLDYRLSTLFKESNDKKQNTELWLNHSEGRNPNKLFDNILEIKFE